MGETIGAIFEKGMADAFYIDLYTRLTVYLNEHIDKAFQGSLKFKSILIGKCQEKFEKTLNDEVEFLPDDDADTYERKVKKKDKQLGNIRFTANLCAKELIAKKVIFMLLDMLLERKTDMTLESVKVIFDVLMDVLIDYCKSANEMQMRMKPLALMDTINMIIKDDTAKVSKRTKFMLKDLVETYQKKKSGSKEGAAGSK